MSNLAELPDDFRVYVPGHGEVAIGELRVVPGAVGGSDEEDLRFWETLVTRNLEFRLCPDGAIRRVRRA